MAYRDTDPKVFVDIGARLSSCDEFCSPRKTTTNGPKPARLAATKKLTASRARKLPADGKALVLNDWVVVIVISAALPSACAIAMRRSNIFRITRVPIPLERGSCGVRSNHRFSQRNYPGRTIFSGRPGRWHSIRLT